LTGLSSNGTFLLAAQPFTVVFQDIVYPEYPVLSFKAVNVHLQPSAHRKLNFLHFLKLLQLNPNTEQD